MGTSASRALHSVVGALLGASFSCIASPAAAGSISFPLSFRDSAGLGVGLRAGETFTDFEAADYLLPTFDPALGPLTGWRVVLSGTVTSRSDAWADNASDLPLAARFSGRAAATIWMPLGVALSLGPVTTSVGICEGIGSCSATVSASAGASNDTGILDPSLLPPSAFGPGGSNWDGATIQVLLESTAYDVTGVELLTVSQSTSFDVTGSLTYFYTPEPGVAALMVGGLTALAGSRRRRL